MSPDELFATVEERQLRSSVGLSHMAGLHVRPLTQEETDRAVATLSRHERHYGPCAHGVHAPRVSGVKGTCTDCGKPAKTPRSLLCETCAVKRHIAQARASYERNAFKYGRGSDAPDVPSQ